MNTFSFLRPSVRIVALVTVVTLSMQTTVLAETDFVMLPPLGDENKFPEGSNANSGSTNQTNDSTIPGVGDGSTNGTNNTGNDVMFELRPHCDSIEYRNAFAVPPKVGTAPIPDGDCPSYGIKDPQTRQTPAMKDGDPIDWDLVIHNPTGQPVQRFRTWINYDPTVMEGELIEIAKAFPTPTPGETDFSEQDGMIKVSAAADTPQTASLIIVAHIRLHTLPSAQSSVPVTFYDATGKTDSHTAVIVKNGGQETNIATAMQGSLIVQMIPSAGANNSAASTGSNNTSAAMSSTATVSSVAASSAPTTNNNSGVFALLQVQHLRVTTEGSSVFLAWDKLPSADLVGYNLYYGTISGQYLQKRSIDKNTTNMTIRALPEGVTYYFAVRGVDKDNQETDFSQEVGISVGNPATSTSPLSANAIERAPSTPRTGGNVSGETGMTSTILLFVLCSALIGTGLAFRRQLSAKV